MRRTVRSVWIVLAVVAAADLTFAPLTLAAVGRSVGIVTGVGFEYDASLALSKLHYDASRIAAPLHYDAGLVVRAAEMELIEL